MTRYQFLQLLAHTPAELIGMATVNQGRQGIDGLAVEHDVQFHQVGVLIASNMVVEGSITLRDGFQFVVKVKDNFAQRHLESQFHTVSREIDLVLQHASAVDAERHDGPSELILRNNLSENVRLFDMVNFRHLGQAAGVVHLNHLAVSFVALERHVGHRGDDVHVEFAIKTFLHDFHVQQAQKTATEAET